MIKIIHKIIIGGLVAGYVLMAGCTETDSSDCLASQGDTNAYYPTLGTVEDVNPITITSDTYGILIPTNPEIFEKNGADSIGQRVFLNVVFQSNTSNPASDAQEVIVLNLYNIPTKAATDLRNAEEIDLNTFGNDPVQITSTSISKEHLNIEFNFKGSGNKTHDFTLILSKGKELDSKGMLPVELRHDAKSDTPVEWYWGVTSFTLKSIPEYELEHFKGFLIRYNSGADSQAVWEVKKSN